MMRPLRIVLLILITIIFISGNAAGQDRESGSKQKEKGKTRDHGMKEKDEEEDPNPFPLRRFEYGINCGAYFANKYSANFYNGAPYNVNTVDYLMEGPTSNYTLPDMKNALGLSPTDVFVVDQYAENMHYNVAFMGGVFLRVNLDRKNGIFLQANYTQLRAADVITFNVLTYLEPNNIMIESVIGKEGRVMIDLGYQRSFPMKSRISLFLQFAATMCYTQVQKSTLVLEGKEFNLINTTDPNTLQSFPVNQNSFGFGGMAGLGANIPLNANFGLEPGFYCQYYPTNLEKYPEFKPSFGLYLRILMHAGSDDDE